MSCRVVVVAMIRVRIGRAQTRQAASSHSGGTEVVQSSTVRVTLSIMLPIHPFPPGLYRRSIVEPTLCSYDGLYMR